jgi:cytochrome P450
VWVVPDLIEQFIDEFDHHDPALGPVTHEVYRAMRERSAVAWSDLYGGFWVVNGYDEAHTALQHYDLFSTSPSVSVPAFHLERPMLPIEVDPPVHNKYRGLITPVFSPPRMVALEGTIRTTATGLIDGFAARGECEFFSAFAEPLPVAIFTAMMGLDRAEVPQFLHWKNDILHGMGQDPEVPQRATRELEAYLFGLIEERHRQPQDDLVSVLIQAEVDGEKLTDEEVYDSAFLLFIAGLDTVSASISLQFLHLAQHPELRDRLVADPSLIPDAVEEMLRFESLIIAGRTVTADTDLLGVRMKKGDRIVMNTVAADRDPRQFRDPDTVDFERSPNRHMAFGVGPHRCVGSHLARIELRIAYEEMHHRLPTYRLAPDAVVHRHADNVHGVDRVPLVWDV